MTKYDRLITLRDAVIYSNHAEENIRLHIERGLLKKYDRHGKLLKNPLRQKGFFKLSELMLVYNIKDPETVKKHFFERKQSIDSTKDVTPRKTIIINKSEMNKINQIEDHSIDTWILSPEFNPKERWNSTSYEEITGKTIRKKVLEYLKESERILKTRGNLLVHSIPQFLPYYGLMLEKVGLFFKYWIVYATEVPQVQNYKGFLPEANGILFYVKSSKNFRINRVREPYRDCSFCSDPLKDYGGKKHLRHKDGMIISDIWRLEYDSNLNSHAIPLSILRRLIDVSCTQESTLLLAPFDGEIAHELRE
ncbi:MAG: hypothetical protein JSV04_09015 [Candidatus Heimdallarchaeota archaeon]|nr:MAG: hypothetical protein JSV04_09015 [Candidatus Heimdallarchaeota archaeon]